MKILQCSLIRESVQPGSHCMLSLTPLPPLKLISQTLKLVFWVLESTFVFCFFFFFLRFLEEFGGSGRLKFVKIGQVTADCVHLGEICRDESEPEGFGKGGLGSDEGFIGKSHCRACGSGSDLAEVDGVAHPLCFGDIRRLYVEACIHLSRLRRWPPDYATADDRFVVRSQRHDGRCYGGGDPEPDVDNGGATAGNPGGPQEDGAAAHRVRHCGVGEAVGPEKELHQAMVEAEGNEGDSLVGQSGEDPERRGAPAGEDLRRHVAVLLHEQAGAPFRD